MENSPVKMAPAFFILGKVICLYLSQSFIGTVAKSYCVSHSSVALNKPLKFLTTVSLCVYTDFQACSIMSAEFNNSNK